MKEFKSIITHPEGQNLFPNQITTIEGYPHGTSITMKNTKPQIALTPYGASYMMPDMHYKFAGNTVVELPQAQMGGGDPQQDQLMQVIQMYAQMKQMDPNELIQKIQSLPQEQQQQAIQSIAQEVQQAMAQQQQAQAPEEGMSSQQMMGENMPQEEMMSHGGEPCIECFDNYNPSPQAQDLNWYYKATGGEAFPQANTYPEDWASYSGNQYAQGGEAFPQAQTYLPNDRPHETRPNFMFQTGGQSDIDNIYQIMKKGGMDLNPRKKKGGKFNHLEEFQKYLKNEKKGHKFQDGGQENTDDEDMDWVANPFAEAESQFSDMQRDFGDGKISDNNSNTAENYAKKNKAENKKLSWDSPEKTAQANVLTGTAAMTGNSGLFGAIAAANNIGRAVGAAASGWSNPGRAFKTPTTKVPVYQKSFDRSQNSNVATQEFNNPFDPTTNINSKSNVPALDKDRYKLDQNNVYDYTNISGNTQMQEGGPYVYTSPNIDNSYFNPLSGDIYLNEDQSHDPSVFPHEYEHYLQWRDGQFKVLPGQYLYEENLPPTLNPNLPLMMPSIARDMDFEGQMPYYNRRPIDQMSETNDFLGENPSFKLVNPQLIYDKVANPEMYENPYAIEGQAQMVGDQYMGPTMQRGGGLPQYQSWISQVGKHWQDKFDPSNVKINKIGEVEVPGDNVPDFALGDSLIAGMQQAGDYLGNFKRKMDPNKDRERRNTHTSEFMDVAQFGGGQYGDWSTNATQGTSFRPNEMVYAQKAGRPYKDIAIYDYPTYDFKDMFSNFGSTIGATTGTAMQIGGNVLDQYNDDEEYDLTPEEIEQIIAAGGTIEYL